MRVLIVDDSVVFRSQIKTALEGIPNIEVVGVANNGKIALQKLAQSSVDLITLDMEMPEMGGIETIQEIKKAKYKTKIIVFSSHTTSGSSAALDALAKGAQDFVAKPSGEGLSFETAAARIKQELVPKILQFLPEPAVTQSGGSHIVEIDLQRQNLVSKAKSFLKKDLNTFHPSVIVIGSSTGGPPALEALLKGLSKPLRVPILITQHMPPVFTQSLANRLEQTSGIKCAEAVDGEILKANQIYIAPGNYHMSIKKIEGQIKICLDQGPPRNSVRPAVDTLFESAAEVFAGKVCGIVLTGMGEDGMIGATAIKEKGGGIIIQDKGSSVVFGMPGAIYNIGAFDLMGDISEINKNLVRLTT